MSVPSDLGRNVLLPWLDDFQALHPRIQLRLSLSDRLADIYSDAVHRWALAGHGIVFKSALDVANSLRAGRLIRLCNDWQGEQAPLSMICADRWQINPAVQRLRVFLMERCETLLSELAIPNTAR
ncbi:MAG: hypothetical protein H6970_02670 [Gammaproteobacteria bacterium]|nr:hypothetical protein [Gammaproteobacteria bacterium]MCP5423962.1 hypothetical protein [Gammaproteobacteria bacterium]MCP5459441.1 hypothetical protein [Gammaproteobacteria bacterium]